MTDKPKRIEGVITLSRALAQKLADMENQSNNEDNGPGYDNCPSCFGSGKWVWLHGSVIRTEPIKHDDGCALEALRAMLTLPQSAPVTVDCRFCGGDGYHAAPRTTGTDCDACKGTGQVPATDEQRADDCDLCGNTGVLGLGLCSCGRS